MTAELAKKYDLEKESEDYGLFFNGKEDFWLGQTEKLSAYDLHKKDGILEFKLKLKSIRISFLNQVIARFSIASQR